MAFDRVTGHFARLIEGTPVRYKAGKEGNSDLISNRGGFLCYANLSAITAHHFHLGQRLKHRCEIVLTRSPMRTDF